MGHRTPHSTVAARSLYLLDYERPVLPAGDEVLVALVQLQNSLHNQCMHPVHLIFCGVVTLLHCRSRDRQHCRDTSVSTGTGCLIPAFPDETEGTCSTGVAM